MSASEPALLMYRVQMPKPKGWSAADHELYEGWIVATDLTGRKDHNGAVSVRFLEGPLEGTEVWLQPEWLERYVSGPSTEGEW